MRLPWLFRVAARLVPRARRVAWKREWAAELSFLDRTWKERGAGAPTRAFRSWLLTFDALEDAVGMWKRNPGTSALAQEGWIATRSLARSPGFTAVAVLTLALGIGATTAIFSVVRSVVLRPLPYTEPEEVVDVVLSFRNLETGADRPIPASEPEFLEIRAGDAAFAELAGYWTGEANFGGGAEPERVAYAGVSANFLRTLGVEPKLGRGFSPGEDLPSAEAVAILSDGLWRRAFGADPTVVGRDARVNGRPMRVVGVLPPSFLFPGNAVDLLVPNVIDPASPGGRSSHYISMLARLAPGTNLEGAQARTDEMARRWDEEYPGRHGVTPRHPLTLIPIRASLIGDAPRMLFLLQGAVGLVLLIACANVASLMLVRAEHRQHETAVRLALGAGRVDVTLPFVAESVILGLFGTVVALVIAQGTVGFLDGMGPDVLQRVGGVRLDGPVLAFALATGLGSMILFGLGPALLAASGPAVVRLHESDRRGTGGRRRIRARRGIVVTQIALSVVLVVASGLLVKSFAHLQAVDPGFRSAGVVTAELSLNSASYPDAEEVTSFYRRLAERLAGTAGVSAVGSVRSLPFADGGGIETLFPTDRPPDPDRSWNAQYQVVGPGYHEAMGIPLLAGRHLTFDDDADAPGATVVSSAMAEAFWPGESPLGHRFRLGHGTDNPELTVVGVVGDVRQGGYQARVMPTFYVPRAQAMQVYGGMGTRGASVVMRSELPAPAALQLLRGVVRDVDPQLPVARMSSMEGVLGRSVASRRFVALLVGAFSVLAVVLGGVGIGGVVAYTVALRTRELGVRMALGADRGRVVRGVLGGALGLAGAGVVLGLLGALLTGRILVDQLVDVSPTDPGILAAGPLVLLVVSLLAAAHPARRATRVDPVEALRNE